MTVIKNPTTGVTGPNDATKAILLTYDIFGYYPQILQRADILASAGKEKYQVFMPDFFEGTPCDISWYVFRILSSPLHLLQSALYIEVTEVLNQNC